MRNSNELVGQRERLLALGKLSAGLTHELNNPAAAAVRATARCATGSPACGTSWRMLADGQDRRPAAARR
jgi:hypothetical protein